MRVRSRLWYAIAVLGAGPILGGCVASESSKYEQKLTSRLKADRASEVRPVATAFGLDDRDDNPIAVAGVPTDR